MINKITQNKERARAIPIVIAGSVLLVGFIASALVIMALETVNRFFNTKQNHFLYKHERLAQVYEQ